MANAAQVATTSVSNADRHRDYQRVPHLQPEVVEVMVLLA